MKLSASPEAVFEPFCIDDGQSIEVDVQSAESMHVVLLQNNEVVAYSREFEEGDGMILKYKNKVDDGDAEFELKTFTSLPNHTIEPESLFAKIKIYDSGYKMIDTLPETC